MRLPSRRTAKPARDFHESLIVVEAAIEEAVRLGGLRKLLEGLMLSRHRRELAQRLRIAQLLLAGLSYRGIEDMTSTSAKTIAAVDRWLRKDNPNYQRLYPIRHKRRFKKSGKFSDAPPGVFPFHYAGQVRAIFGLDPRQK